MFIVCSYDILSIDSLWATFEGNPLSALGYKKLQRKIHDDRKKL